MGSEATGSEAAGSGATAAGAFFFSIAGRGACVGRLGFFPSIRKLMGRERRGCVRGGEVDGTGGREGLCTGKVTVGLGSFQKTRRLVSTRAPPNPLRTASRVRGTARLHRYVYSVLPSSLTLEKYLYSVFPSSTNTS